jgi:hypothetical protein
VVPQGGARMRRSGGAQAGASGRVHLVLSFPLRRVWRRRARAWWSARGCMLCGRAGRAALPGEGTVVRAIESQVTIFVLCALLSSQASATCAHAWRSCRLCERAGFLAAPAAASRARLSASIRKSMSTCAAAGCVIRGRAALVARAAQDAACLLPRTSRACACGAPRSVVCAKAHRHRPPLSSLCHSAVTRVYQTRCSSVGA